MKLNKYLLLVVMGVISINSYADGCTLQFTSPANGSSFKSPGITVYGHGGADAKYGDYGTVTATLNGTVIFTYSGSFTTAISFLETRGVPVTLKEGLNSFFVLGSVGGCSAADQIYVYYEPDIEKSKNSGLPSITPSCNEPSSNKGNPINISIGNKFQHEVDITGTGAYPLTFERFYNSTTGSWRHNYSEKLTITDYSNVKKITLSFADGRGTSFTESGNTIISAPTELGKLSKIANGYQYVSPFNDIYDFNELGALTRTVNNNGLVHNIKQISDTEHSVSDSFGKSITFTQDKNGQPLSVKTSDGRKVIYDYDTQERLIKVTQNGRTKTYHYEDSKFPRALTGITDERGVRYATWTYDASGRANSSSHDGGKDKISITYNSDTQTTYTNPLNRTYIYTYQVIDGVKKITKIQGNASSMCPAIGSSYEYDAKGLVTLMTNGRGIKTKYEYNTKGQEISRIVGFGSANALTIKTTWDNSFNLPKTETYPDKTITYDYDGNGKLISQTVSATN